MSARAPRFVPLISGVVALAIAVAVLAIWTAPTGFLYWVRNGIFGLLTWYGLWDLKIAAFARDDQIHRATSGDVEVWKEAGVVAPSAFDPRDILFLLAALSVLLIFVTVVACIVGIF
jgi:hypothetical protein